MATVRFESSDRRDLIEVLIKANVSDDAPEAVEIDGKPHALRDIWKLLSYEEPLQPHHQEQVDRLFGKRQGGTVKLPIICGTVSTLGKYKRIARQR
jgi:hypothetical protein